MDACRNKDISRELLGEAARLFIGNKDLTFQDARAIADREAEKFSPEPMLLAWYDKKAAAFSPRVT